MPCTAKTPSERSEPSKPRFVAPCDGCRKSSFSVYWQNQIRKPPRGRSPPPRRRSLQEKPAKEARITIRRCPSRKRTCERPKPACKMPGKAPRGARSRNGSLSSRACSVLRVSRQRPANQRHRGGGCPPLAVNLLSRMVDSLEAYSPRHPTVRTGNVTRSSRAGGGVNHHGHPHRADRLGRGPGSR